MAHACPYTVTVGAYVLGVLCERESTEFRRHAEVCPSCGREIAELAPTVRLLETLKTETHAANGHAPLADPSQQRVAGAPPGTPSGACPTEHEERVS
jgi:hypothetical protein